jgi:2-C-methyl-D-erythritol 4-phosphate cytidylyltransferase
LRIAAVVPAAGRGERLGPGAPKALREVGGVPMLVRSVRALASARLVDAVLVAAPPATVGAVRALLLDHELPAEVSVVAGGATRQESVRLALAALPSDVEVVLVHDAARPLVPAELVDAVAAAVLQGADAVVPALPVVETIKEVDGSSLVRLTLERARLRAVQTPQGFRRSVLEQAHAAAPGGDATDDAGLVERLGVPVRVVAGAEEAFKVTRPLDLLLAEALIGSQRAR